MKRLALVLLTFSLVVGAFALRATGPATHAQPQPSPTVVPIRTPVPGEEETPGPETGFFVPEGLNSDLAENIWYKIFNRYLHIVDDVANAWKQRASERNTMRDLLAEGLQNTWNHYWTCLDSAETAAIREAEAAPPGQFSKVYGEASQRNRCLCRVSLLAEINATASWLTNTQANYTFQSYRDDVAALEGQFLIEAAGLTNSADLSDEEFAALNAGVTKLYSRMQDEEKADEKDYLDVMNQVFIEPFREQLQFENTSEGCPPLTTTSSVLSCPSPDADSAPPHE